MLLAWKDMIGEIENKYDCFMGNFLSFTQFLDLFDFTILNGVFHLLSRSV